MRLTALCLIAAAALTGCSGNSGEYAMSTEQVRSKLLDASFERGILPGSSGLKPRVQESSEGNGSLEWQVLAEDDRNGWWCPISIEPVDGDASKTKVVNNCAGITGSNNSRNLDELVDATLTGRPPKFD